MRLHRGSIPVALAGLFALATPTAGLADDFYAVIRSDWTGLQSSDVSEASSFSAPQPGRFVRTRAVDLAFLADDRLVVMNNAAAYSNFITVETGVLDFAVIPGGPGVRERLAVTTASGLHEVWFDDVAWQWETAPLETTLFAGAIMLRAGDLDGDGDLDFLGVAANGKGIMLALQQPDGSYASSSPFSTPLPPSQVSLVEWEGDADAEVAFTVPGGLLVHDVLTGALEVTHRSLTAFDDHLVRLPTSTPTSRLAWITAGGAPDEQDLFVVDAAGIEPALTFVGRGIIGMAAGDLDEDGRPDLALSCDETGDLALVPQQSTGSATFTLSEVQDLSFFNPSSSNFALASAPLIADLNRDLGPDLCVSTLGQKSVVQVYGQRQQPPIPGSLADPLAYVSEGDQHVFVIAPDGDSGEFQLSLSPSATLDAADGIHVTVWLQPSIGGWLDVDPVSEFAIDLSAHVVGEGYLMRVPIPEGVMGWDRVYYVEFEALKAGIGDSEYGGANLSAITTVTPQQPIVTHPVNSAHFATTSVLSPAFGMQTDPPTVLNHGETEAGGIDPTRLPPPGGGTQ